MTEWTLIDAVARHAANPDTFDIPSSEEIADIKVDDYVKIGMEKRGGGERFWVIVKEIKDDHFVGAVNNDLIYVDLELDAPIEFEAKNVLDILKKD